MRVVATGDTHGQLEKIKKEIKLLPGIDLLLHTGDHYRDGMTLGSQLQLKYHIVSGNCDSNEKVAREVILTLEGIKILLTHGHLQRVKLTMNNLYFRAREIGAGLVIFGHTHVPYLEKTGDTWFLNPGSPSYPRAGTKASYGLVEITASRIEPRLIYL
ncbi:MAG: YfcE family phosphodiesterase [Chitinophagales bacterium]